jgi:hypothetical protein
MQVNQSSSKKTFDTPYQPGGTMTIVRGKWAGRATTEGNDDGMGRWSEVRIAGKDGRAVRIITAYRVCNNSIAAASTKTAFRQQYLILDEAGIKNPNPRKQMLADLEKRIKQIKAWGEDVILMIDANEGLQSSRGEFAKWVQSVGLADVMVQRHGTECKPETHINGKELIDFILATPAVTDFIVAAGILDYHEFTQSDHRALYMDMDMAKLLGGEPSPLENGAKRGIMSNDPRAVAVYREKLEKLLDESNIEAEMEKLLANIKDNNGVLCRKLAKEAERLDEKLTTMKQVSERLCRKIHSLPWSPKLREARNRLRYWHMWLTQRKTRVDLEEKRHKLDPTGKFWGSELDEVQAATTQTESKMNSNNNEGLPIIVETVLETESEIEPVCAAQVT